MTEVGVEPTNHEALDLAALPVCVPSHVKLRVRGSHPTVQAYEAQLSTGSPAMSLFSSQGEIRTPMPQGHDVLSVACIPVPPLGYCQ